MRVEVLSVSDTGRRRRWTMAEKVRIVEESLEPGAVAAEVARRHEISRSLIYDWRHRYRTGQFADGGPPLTPFTRIVPTEVGDEPTALPAPAAAGVGDEEPPEPPSFASPVLASASSLDPLVIEFRDGAQVSVPSGYDMDAALRLISTMRDVR